MDNELKNQKTTQKKNIIPIWPSFKGKSSLIGTSKSGRVNVYVDLIIGKPGIINTQDLLNDSDRVVMANDSIFGTLGGNTNIIILALNNKTDGTGGADHMGCDYINGANIEVCASFNNSSRVSALFEAELSECSMNGNLCGYSTGEALSRWCASIINNNALKDFTTAPLWQKDGKPDFINQLEQSDSNPVSTGCGMVFISWLLTQGLSINKIAHGLVLLGDTGTFSQLYSQLTTKPANEAWPNFLKALEFLSEDIINDDPFNALSKSQNTPVNLIEVILPTTKKFNNTLQCEIKSRRLLPPV